MNIRIKTDSVNVEWEKVRELLLNENMGVYSTERHRIAFEKSTKIIFVYDDDFLIGCGRLLSDASYQGVLYDIVVNHKYQGNGIGKMIVSKLLKEEEDKNILLYASPGKEVFYEKLGFSKSKTAMCRFIDPMTAIEKGFID